METASCFRGKATAGVISIPFRPKAGPAKLLTPGAFEIEHVSLSHDRRELLFSSNQDDIDRRHIWRVAAGRRHGDADRQAERRDRMGAGRCGQWSGGVFAVEPEGNRTRGGDRRAVRTTWRPRRSPPIFRSTSKWFRSKSFSLAPTACRFTANFFCPKGAGKHPAIVFFHGGSRRQMLLGWHYMYYYSNTYGMNQYLASKGYVVLSVNYRSGIGYGLNFREASELRRVRRQRI